MKYDDFLDYILPFGVSFPDNENERIAVLDKICSVAGKKELHYLWSSYRSPRFIAQKKISCRQNEYRSTAEKIFTGEKYITVIDSCCFEDNDRHIIFQSDRKSLTDILTHFYWDLDEIYISNSDLDWFISVNHNFELHFYCKEDSSWLTYYKSKLIIEN